MKKCSISLAFKKMQIKMTLKFPLTPVTVVIIKKINKKFWCGCRWKRNPYILLVGMQISVPTVKISMKVPQKTENEATI
jgi:hypothetical protein